MSDNQEPVKLDLQYGGQQSNAPSLSDWLANPPHVPRNTIPVVTRLFSEPYLSSKSEAFVRSVQTIITYYIVAQTGLLDGRRFDRSTFDEVRIINTASESEPIPTIGDRYGAPADAIIKEWMADLVQVLNLEEGETHPLGWTLEALSLDVFFIVPDATHTLVQNAWECKQFFPVETTGHQGQRDIRVGAPTADLVVTFAALTECTDEVRERAAPLFASLVAMSASPAQDRAHFLDGLEQRAE